MVNQYFDEVITLLTMMGEKSISKKVDKATTLKEAASFIRLYFDLASVMAPSSPVQGAKCVEHTPALECLQNGDVLHFFLNAMDAFMMIVSESGRIFYCTELVTSLLGHMQSRLVGQNLFDYVLEQEVPLLKDLFKPQEGQPGKDLPHCPVVSYPHREFQCSLKMYNGETGLFPQHLLFQCLSYLRVWKKKKTSSPDPPSPDEADTHVSKDSSIQSCILLIAKLPTSPSVVDLPVSTNEVNFQFDMRVSREGKIIDIEKHAALVLGYLPGELVGSSFFDYIDPYQLTHLAESIVVIFSKGLGTTTPSRMRSKCGRYIWVISKGYLSYNPWNHKPDHILLSTRVLGCDQVLSEHKFYRDSKVVPDLINTEEWYDPRPLPMSNSSSDSNNTDSGFIAGSLVHSDQPHLHPPPPPGEASMYSAGAITCDDVSAASENLKDIRRELNLKNQELFNLQCRFLEQQQLMEKERNQFYQITRQVMQCITYPQSVVSPNGQMPGRNVQPPLDMMSFQPSTKMNAMQSYSQEFNYMVDQSASSSNQYMEGSLGAPLPDAMLSYQQNAHHLFFPPSEELSSPSMPMPSQNDSYSSSTSHNNLQPPHTPASTKMQAHSSYTPMPSTTPFSPPSSHK